MAQERDTTPTPRSTTPRTASCEPTHISGPAAKILKRLDYTPRPDPPEPTPAEIAAREERDRRWAAEQAKHDAESYWRLLAERIGRRYEQCTLDNFETDEGPSQAAVVAKLRAFADALSSPRDRGKGLILFGPIGTGKDHLLAAMMRHAVLHARILSVAWMNGIGLHQRVRETMAPGAADSEREIIKRYVKPTILAISDPLPPGSNLNDFQRGTLFSILDRRYRDMKPTWITVNVRNRVELGERMGEANAERIIDGALALFCDWPSYRKTQKV